MKQIDDVYLEDHTDNEYEQWFEDKEILEYKPYNVLTSVDSLLEEYNLEIVTYDLSAETYFSIERKK